MRLTQWGGWILTLAPFSFQSYTLEWTLSKASRTRLVHPRSWGTSSFQVTIQTSCMDRTQTGRKEFPEPSLLLVTVRNSHWALLASGNTSRDNHSSVTAKIKQPVLPAQP